jgi:hypothetical protein
MTPRKHKHADMMRQWLDNDSLEVEYMDSHGLWCANKPIWSEEIEYRFKPKMITVGEHSFPEPMRVAPADGTRYWCVDITINSGLITETCTWRNDRWDEMAMGYGICHTTQAAAEAHAKALIALTEVKE